MVIAEVVLLFLAGSLLGRWASSVLGLSDWIGEANEMILSQNINFTGIANRSAVNLAFKYISVFSLVIMVLWLRKKPVRPYMGMGRANLPLADQFKSGLLLFCLIGFIPKILFGLWPLGLVGDGPAHWQMLHSEWDLDFWIYMMVGSIIIPPIVEELFFRGFTLSRLSEAFSTGYAILIMALLFAGFHTQYYQMSIISIAQLVLLFFSSVVLGYSRVYSGTIIPALVAHALVNIPVVGTPALVLGGVMVIIVGLKWKVLSSYAREFFNLIE